MAMRWETKEKRHTLISAATTHAMYVDYSLLQHAAFCGNNQAARID